MVKAYQLLNENKQGGQLKNCPITVADMIRAEKIYGPSIATLKGKTVRCSPQQVITDLMEVLKHILEAIPFFTLISRNIKFTTTKNIPLRTASQLAKSMKHVLAIYKKRGFAPLQAEMLTLGVTLNITSANEHVPEIERRICLLKEQT
jgi:hypothetical protein